MRVVKLFIPPALAWPGAPRPAVDMADSGVRAAMQGDEVTQDARSRSTRSRLGRQMRSKGKAGMNSEEVLKMRGYKV